MILILQKNLVSQRMIILVTITLSLKIIALDPNQVLSQTKALLLVILEKQSNMQVIEEVFLEDENAG